MTDQVAVLRLLSHANSRQGIDPAARDPSSAASALGWLAAQTRITEEFGPYSYDLATPLSALGWLTHDLILDEEEVLPAWEREFGPIGIRYQQRRLFGLVVAAVARLRPQVLIDMNLKLSRDEILVLRDLFPDLRLFVGWISTPKRFHRSLYHDVLLTPCDAIRRALHKIGCHQVYIVHHAFNTAALTLPLPPERLHHAVFSGSLYGRGHETRTKIVESLAASRAIEAWVDTTERSERSPASPRRLVGLTRRMPVRLLARLNQRTGRFGVSLDERLGSVDERRVDLSQHSAPQTPLLTRGTVQGREMFQLFGAARIVLHVAGDVPRGCAGALRLFEATGMGALLLTNDSAALADLFDIGSEVLTFRDAEEARETIGTLAEDPATLERIRLAGQSRTLRDHTPQRRAEQLATILTSLEAESTARPSRWSLLN